MMSWRREGDTEKALIYAAVSAGAVGLLERRNGCLGAIEDVEEL